MQWLATSAQLYSHSVGLTKHQLMADATELKFP